MTIEDDLADAMAAHVAEVQAGPGLGSAVRRAHRARLTRFRVAGAAIVAAAVAVTVPVMLNPGEPADTGQNGVVMRNDVTVPDVTGRRATEAAKALHDTGLKVALTGMRSDNGLVGTQEPAAGKVVARGSTVTLDVQLPPAPTPQALGDLGDGRKFGGIQLTYLPDGLEWGKWSKDDVVGPGKSYTTSFRKPGPQQAGYAVQVIVAHGASADALYDFRPEPRAETVDLDGRPARLSKEGDSGAAGGPVTPAVTWKLRKDLAVKVLIGPEYAKEIDAMSELRKIAKGVRPVR
ncbi:PASTA domain-containing protein [Nonomuraea sp. NPDC001636]|uniref:PASTA domain-containing protein n=1 Tax=Nonomuraea sp. NPDC001636 TaxID=3154391 RepID=UPI00332DDD63